MAQSPEWHPEYYRDLVRLWARQLHLDRSLHCLFDASDLAQDTMLKAHVKKGACRAPTEAGRIKWLHTILLNQLRDQIDHAKAARRNFGRERSLHKILDESAATLLKGLQDDQSSPSEQSARHEQELRLAAALAQLPEDQRDVVILHKLTNASVAEIASQLKRSQKAVAELLRRGMQKLGEILQDNQ
jgi:RNA polymerase sigma-70 factor (ECF subfamily)